MRSSASQSQGEEDMLGDTVGSETGQVTSRRILPGDDYRYVKMEITFESECELLGQQGQNIGTYTIWERVPGQIYGEGQGIFMTAGGESAIWNGHGVGQGSADGSIAIAASVAFQAGAGALEGLNNMLVVVEHHAHGNGHIHSTLYAWTAPQH
jgi:hypothetical protein